MSPTAPRRAFLLERLDSDLAALLAQEGDLPPAVRAALADELRHDLAACAAYIPARLVRAQLADPWPGRVGGAFWHGSLLFADLSGFTAMSERLSVLGKQGAEEVSAIINQVFAALIAEVTSYQGMLLKFGGDALTVFFDAATLGVDHAAAAVSTALAMQQRMAAFGAVETRAGTFQLGLRVGVHSGRVFAAEVGDASHIELVVTGPEVNRVALAQEIASPGEVVITDQTAALLEGALLTPRDAGFQHVRSLLYFHLPPAPPDPIALDGPADLAALELMAAQAAALRPYLVHSLPRRFLEASETGLGEFRPVSVIFANFHDFSAILTSLDAPPAPDPAAADPGGGASVAAAVLNAYYRRAQAIVHHYDGIVNKVDMYTHGDKLMALFGAPTVHEDDPLRAVRCALDLEQALEEANAEISELLTDQETRGQGDKETRRPGDSEIVVTSPISLSPGLPVSRSPGLLVQKVGINTGTVFAGRVGGTRRYEYTVMGPAVNLAARLMSAASDGVVLLSPATRAAVAHQIAVEDQAPLKLKGLAQPVVPARALYVADSGSRAAETRLARAPLIGRDAELYQLTAAARLALRGQGRTLAIVGEAGAGKSRLAEELTLALVLISGPGEDLDEVPSFLIYGGDCQSYEQRTPYIGIRAPLRQLLGIVGQPGEPPRKRGGTAPLAPATTFARIEARVEHLAPEMVRFAPLLGDVLGVELPETALTRALTPQQRHDRVQELLVALFVAAAHEDPLLLQIDDIHWADSSSIEVLGRLAAAIATAPLLLMLTYRSLPPIPEPWRALPATTRIALGELSPESSADLLAALLDGSPPPGILPLLDRTQGNPYFIEELVRTLIASGALERGAGGAWRLTRPLAQVSIPDSIEGLLHASLDRLDEPRYELIQVASVVGRRFQPPVVEGVYNSAAPLSESLERLVAIEMIIAEQQQQALAYLFRHALLRDVAYERILYARRRDLHSRVARRIKGLYGATGMPADEHLALLAWHHLRAEEWEEAFRYHQEAGAQAQRRFANRDALELFRTALEIAPNLATRRDPAALIAEVAGLHERAGELHAILGEYDEALAAYEEALKLAMATPQRPGDRQGEAFAPSSTPWWSSSGANASLLPETAETASPAVRLVRLHRLIASVHERRSDYTAAFDWLTRGLAYGSSAAEAEVARCYLLGAGMYQRQGQYARSLEWAGIGLRTAERTSSLRDQAEAFMQMGSTYLKMGDNQRALELTHRCLALYEQLQDLTRQADAHNNLAIQCQMLGRFAEARSHFEAGARIKESIGDIYGQAMIANNLGELLRLQDEMDEAIVQYGRSLAIFERLGSRYATGVLHMNLGASYLLRGDLTAAQEHLERSGALFAEAGAEDFLAELQRYRAELWLRRGDLARARARCEESLATAARLEAAAEEGAARRTLGRILAQGGDLAGAWAELERSLAIVRKADSPPEIARTLVAMAALAPALSRFAAGQAALAEALPILRGLGARRDIAEAMEVAEHWEYDVVEG